MTPPQRRSDTVAAAALASGFAALTYQTVWQRVLGQILGADTVSVAIVVGAFMAGLGSGALAAAPLIRRTRRPAFAYTLLEVAIGLGGAISVPVLRAANEAFSSWGAGALAVDALLNLGLLAVPVFLMGMTGPLIVEVGKNTIADFGRRTGTLYGANIFGAGLGAMLSGLVLIELLGLWGTALVASLLNATAAALIGWRSGESDAQRVARVADGQISSPAGRRAWLPLLVGGCLFLGYASLSLQMVFFRVLANYFTLSALVFPIVLTSFLLLLSAGQLIGGRLADRWEGANRPALLVTLAATSAILLFAAIAFPPSWAAPLGALVFSPSVADMVQDTGVRIGDPNLLVAFAFSLVCMLAVLPQSALFPVIVKASTDRIAVGGRRFAQVYGAYTAGNLLGALVTGLVVFEYAGLTGALWLTVLAAAAGITAVSAAIAGRRGVRAGALCLAISLVVGASFTRDYWTGFSAGRYVPVAAVEGRSGVVSVVLTGRFYALIDMFRTESASAITRPPVVGEQYEAWRWNFSDLFALDPWFRPRRVLLIGIGHGYLPLTLLEYDFIEKIVVVEISAEIVTAVRDRSSEDLRRVFSDPRIEIVIADGRRYLQSAVARGERFDLIQNRINEPWRSGGGALFTVEFFGLMSRSLSPGGGMWLRGI